MRRAELRRQLASILHPFLPAQFADAIAHLLFAHLQGARDLRDRPPIEHPPQNLLPPRRRTTWTRPIGALAPRIAHKPLRPLHLMPIQQPAAQITHHLVPTVLRIGARETADAMTAVTSKG